MITLKVFTFVCLDIWYFLTAHISVWCISPTLENAFSFITPSLSSKTVTFSLSFFGFLHMAIIWTIKNQQQRPESQKQETWNGNVSDFVLEGLKTNCTNSISWISIKVYLLNINPLWLSLDWVVLVQLKPLLRLCQLWAEHEPTWLGHFAGTLHHTLCLSSSNALQRLQILRQVHKIETTNIVNCHSNWGTQKHVFFFGQNYKF